MYRCTRSQGLNMSQAPSFNLARGIVKLTGSIPVFSRNPASGKGHLRLLALGSKFGSRLALHRSIVRFASQEPGVEPLLLIK